MNNYLWYNNISVLFTNLNQINPFDNNILLFNKINSFARISLYCIILIYCFDLNKDLLLIPFIILIFSFYIGYTLPNNLPNNLIKELFNNNCQHPTVNNPFMNYTLGDLISKPNRLEACNVEDINIKKEIKDKFKSDKYLDLSNLWNKNLSDITFYTMANTKIVNDSTKFAEWCYNSKKSGRCKSSGKNCKINDNTYFISRILK